MSMDKPHEIWIEQCEAAETIRERYGIPCERRICAWNLSTVFPTDWLLVAGFRHCRSRGNVNDQSRTLDRRVGGLIL